MFHIISLFTIWDYRSHNVILSHQTWPSALYCCKADYLSLSNLANSPPPPPPPQPPSPIGSVTYHCKPIKLELTCGWNSIGIRMSVPNRSTDSLRWLPCTGSMTNHRSNPYVSFSWWWVSWTYPYPRVETIVCCLRGGVLIINIVTFPLIWVQLLLTNQMNFIPSKH